MLLSDYKPYVSGISGFLASAAVIIGGLNVFLSDSSKDQLGDYNLRFWYWLSNRDLKTRFYALYINRKMFDLIVVIIPKIICLVLVCFLTLLFVAYLLLYANDAANQIDKPMEVVIPALTLVLQLSVLQWPLRRGSKL